MCRCESLAELRVACAARVSALVAALRGIPDELAPCRRAAAVAVREQIYYGWEQPLARASHARLLFGKYERDGWWSTAAAELVRSGGVVQGTGQLARDHVEPVRRIVADLLAVPRTPEETAALLDTRLLTCTVLADEHRRLERAPGDGWQRYAAAGVAVRRGLPEARV
ncbi:MAG: hypothetical protein M3065_01815 [Actinomycetota bacterium]|nr:hypothetical protein [Actinomycetota bacterium]